MPSRGQEGVLVSKWILVVLGVALAAGFATWLVLTQWPAGESAVTETTPAAGAPQVPAAVEGSTAAPVTQAPASPEPKPAAPPRTALSSVEGVISEGEYAHSTKVSDVEVHWMNDSRVLCVGLVSPGTGYVAIGLDPADGMLGANFILGSVREGIVTVRDDYGNSATGHDADTKLGGADHVMSSAGHQWADQTVVEFVIPLDSGDSTDKRLVPGETYPILVAYNDLSDDFSARHTRRGTGEITLDPAP
jgi:hypothetical protein